MDNLIVILIVGAIVGLASGYIYKAKKRGQKCIGCPAASNCSGHCSGNCSGCSGTCGHK